MADYVFRRIRGKIRPIKVRNRDVATAGSALAGAGLGARFVGKGIAARAVSRGVAGMPTSQVAKSFKLGRKIFNVGRAGAIIGSAATLGAGAHQGIKYLKRRFGG